MSEPDTVNLWKVTLWFLIIMMALFGGGIVLGVVIDEVLYAVR